MIEVAHVSDLHFAWDRGQAGVKAGGFLNKRLLGYANLRFHRKHPQAIADALRDDLRAHPPDHLAVTGDLTNLALPGEFDRARSWLESLELPPERISLIPGNHDAYVKGGLDLFEQSFAPWLRGEARWPRRDRCGEVELFLTSSSIPVPWFRAYGELGEEQLARLSHALEGSEAAFRMVLVHHPPVLGDGQPDKRRRNNRDGARLIDLCRGRADMILCGHTHLAFDYVYPDERPLRVQCAGSTTMQPKRFGEGATYNRYRVHEGQLQDVLVRGFDLAAGRFRAVPAPLTLQRAPGA